MPSLSIVTPIKISAAGRTPSIARDLPVTIHVPGAWEDLTIGTVKHALAEKFPKVRGMISCSASDADLLQFYPTRQKLSKVGDRAALGDEVKLIDTGLNEDGAELTVKDLGPQISWKTVFLVEYVGLCLLCHMFGWANS
jgi:very-long-chain enoyl-CoA reductase